MAEERTVTVKPYEARETKRQAADNRLPGEREKEILTWISKELRPSHNNTFNRDITTSDLLEEVKSSGVPATGNELHALILRSGYKCEDALEDGDYWYNISHLSPTLDPFTSAEKDLTFREYMVDAYFGNNNAYGRVASQALADFALDDFRDISDEEGLEKYLEDKGYDEATISTYMGLWTEYLYRKAAYVFTDRYRKVSYPDEFPGANHLVWYDREDPRFEVPDDLPLPILKEGYALSSFLLYLRSAFGAQADGRYLFWGYDLDKAPDRGMTKINENLASEIRESMNYAPKELWDNSRVFDAGNRYLTRNEQEARRAIKSFLQELCPWLFEPDEENL